MDMHIVRISVKVVRYGKGVKWIRIELRMKHTKTDQSGEQRFVNTFIVDPDENGLSAGEAILKMLENHRRWDINKDTPAFRD